MSNQIKPHSKQYTAEVMLNTNAYSGETIDYLAVEIGPDYFIDRGLKIGLKWESSAVDWETIWAVFDITDKEMILELGKIVLTALFAEFFVLAKHLLKARSKKIDSHPVIEMSIRIENINILLEGINESNVEKVKEEKLAEFVLEALRQNKGFASFIDDIVDEDVAEKVVSCVSDEYVLVENGEGLSVSMEVENED